MKREQILQIMDDAWSDEFEYTAPSLERYPWQWLWDSCFHSIIWAALEDERALRELTTVFRWQTASGFVPHMGYQLAPEASEELWDQHGSSTITQPPMHGHAAAELERRGIAVGAELLERSHCALDVLWRTRMTDCGLLRVIHPWETGLDDNPRWDDWCPPNFVRTTWRERKGEFVRALRRSSDGMAVGSPLFEVCDVGFNALFAFNSMELSSVTNDAQLLERGEAITQALEQHWDAERCTWLSAHPDGRSDGSLGARSVDALLPLLVVPPGDREREILGLLTDPHAYGAEFGPATVHRAEPTFDPNGYWRGSVWGQMNYLLWVAARRAGDRETATLLARQTMSGATQSGFAEYWNPDTGEGHGAIPQTWTCLAYPMSLELPHPADE